MVWVITGPSALAQPAPPTLTLAQALEAAWARHPVAQAQPGWKAEARARQEQSQALTAGPATLAISQLSDRFNSSPGSRLGRSETELEVSTPLWWPGQREARQREADAAAQDALARSELARWQLAGELREAWWALAQQREQLSLARQREGSALELLSTVERRYQAGDLARTEAHTARSEWLAAQSETLEAKTALDRAESAFQALTGLLAPAELAAEATADAVSDEAPSNKVCNRVSNQLSDTALGLLAESTAISASPDCHPALRALASASAWARRRLSLAQGGGARPSPELGLRWQQQRSESGQPAGHALGLRFSLPFGTTASVQADQGRAQAELAQAEAEQQQAVARLAQEQHSAHAELTRAAIQQALARERLSLATDTLALATKAFALGEWDLPSLLKARRDGFEAAAALNRWTLARRQAQSRLRHALGEWP